METLELRIEGKPARVYAGGSGPPIMLVHGGWGGARMHWSRVWDRLAERHRVIAPDLPGLGDLAARPLGSVRAYAHWLVALLDELDVERASCVGNSFGGSVVWSLAGRAPDRCSALVLVNGFAMPRTPRLLLSLGHTRPGRRLMRAIIRRVSYRPGAEARAFADPALEPPELIAMLAQKEPALLRPFTDIILEGDGPPAPRIAPLLLWGEADRLPGTGADAARKLHDSLPGSTLVFIPHAGHFPQIEAPDLFVDRLEAFLGRQTRLTQPEKARVRGSTDRVRKEGSMAAPFVHIELATDDTKKAKAFYSELFGWKFQDIPGEYSLFDTGKEPGGGIFERPAGAPVGWTVYVGVPDAAAALAKARELGGKVLKDVTLISPEWGSFAVLQDPTGATICVHQAPQMPATKPAGAETAAETQH